MALPTDTEIEEDDIFEGIFLRNTKKHYFCILNLNTEGNEEDIPAIEAKEKE